MIKHAAVCIVLVALAVADDVIVAGLRCNGEDEADKKELLSEGRDKWRVSWFKRANMEKKPVARRALTRR